MDMVNLYKKIMVGVDVEKALESTVEDTGSGVTEAEPIADDIGQAASMDHSFDISSGPWKQNFVVNPHVDVYGNGKAEIVDFAVVDENGLLSTTIVKGSTFSIYSKVHFNEPVADPIFTFTIKDIHGRDITGTNTMYERVSVGPTAPGEEYVAGFTQAMDLQGGEYLLSISCTGFEEGELIAYQRCYDLLSLTVISDKNTVGYYDMNSKTTVTKVN